MRALFLLLALALTVSTGCQPSSSEEAVPPSVEVADQAAPAEIAGPPAPTTAQPNVQPTPAPAGEPLGPDGRPEVVLYVTSWCPYCQQAREFMAAEDIPHRVVDIEASQEGAREYAARGGTGGIPLVAVGVETIEGWNVDVARRMLDTAGYF